MMFFYIIIYMNIIVLCCYHPNLIHIHARIIPDDSQLTVYPATTSCKEEQKRHNAKNCGIIRLDNNHSWILKSGDEKYSGINVTVPGDIITDLYEANIISDPFYNNNFLDEQEIWMGGVPSNNKPRRKNNSNHRGSSENYNNHHHHHQNHDIFKRIKNYTYSQCYPNQNNKRTETGSVFIPGLKPRERVWIYERNFTLTVQQSTTHIGGGGGVSFRNRNAKIHNSNYPLSLVIEGIKMGAGIEINGIHIGNVTNQFKRYIIPISRNIVKLGREIWDENDRSNLNDNKNKLKALSSEHTITVSFYPDIDTNGRFMACSGGWDWAPYTESAEASCLSRRVFSFGIVKPIYIIEGRVSIVHVVPKILLLQEIAPPLTTTNNIREGQIDGDFSLIVDVHLMHNGALNGIVIFRAPFWGEDKTIILDKESIIDSGNNISIVTLDTTVRRQDIELWWPRGFGKPRLYILEVAYQNLVEEEMSNTVWVQKRIGFRSIRLVTRNEFDNSEHMLPNEGQGNMFHGMYFRINGHLINCRGANVVPMSQLEGYHDEMAHRLLVQSAYDANMNMLRVWGGGTILPNSFYESCDEMGILLYHDLMFVEEQFHSPQRNEEVEDEIKYIVRILSSHPSIVMWNGCNECERTQNITHDIYSDFVMKCVVHEDPTRPIWPSSPSVSGWKTGVNTMTGLPNGQPFTYWPSGMSNHIIEIHGPYLHGSSVRYPTVNGHPSNSTFDTNIPIILRNTTKVGPKYPNQFISEFGASAYSSFESMGVTISKEYWSIHGNVKADNCTIIFENLNLCTGSNVMSQRNYPCDNIITAYFGNKINLNQLGEASFRRQLYMCMISQSLWMKGTIEVQRSRNSMGLLIWMMGEHWPTGGWGLVEYGSQSGKAGQVLGGRWKPLMYLLKRTLFRDIIAACGLGGQCYCRNDGSKAFSGVVQIEKYDFVNGIVSSIIDLRITLNEGAIEYFTIDMAEMRSCCDALALYVYDDHGIEVMGENISLFAAPKDLSLAIDHVIVIKSILLKEDDTIEISIISNKMALYVMLSCEAQGQFDDNAFTLQAQRRKKVLFIPTDSRQNNIKILQDTLTAQHLTNNYSLPVTYFDQSMKNTKI